MPNPPTPPEILETPLPIVRLDAGPPRISLGVSPTFVEPLSGYGDGWPSGLPRACTQAARTGFTRDSRPISR